MAVLTWPGLGLSERCSTDANRASARVAVVLAWYVASCISEPPCWFAPALMTLRKAAAGGVVLVDELSTGPYSPWRTPGGAAACMPGCLPPQAGYYRRMSDELFVPEDFAVPDGLMAGEFRLTPLGPQHNEADYAAWTASIDHIRATPGFTGATWPHEMSLTDNLRDLERHA